MLRNLLENLGLKQIVRVPVKRESEVHLSLLMNIPAQSTKLSWYYGYPYTIQFHRAKIWWNAASKAAPDLTLDAAVTELKSGLRNVSHTLR